MDKLPLIGVSLCAVILLALGSLSNVIGYQSVKSTAMNDSPLFQTRTQRATNQEHFIITSQYLGKEKDWIPFPLRDNKTSMIRKFKNQIGNMDDNTFRKFVKYAIRLLTQQGTVKYRDAKDIENGFHQLRENSEVYHGSTNLNIGNYTWMSTPTICWFPGCFLLFIFVVVLLTIGFHCFPTEKICINAFPLPLMKISNFI
jgi:hypothetical protein